MADNEKNQQKQESLVLLVSLGFRIGLAMLGEERFMEPFLIFCMVLMATWHWSASSCWVSLHACLAERMQLLKCVAVSFGIIVHLTYILSYRLGLSHSLIVLVKYVR